MSSWIVNILFKIISRIKLTYWFSEPVLITSPTGFDIAFTIVEAKLEQSWDKVVSTLFQRRTATLYQCCATLKIRRRILFHFQRRLFQRWSTTLKQRWSDVEMLAGVPLLSWNELGEKSRATIILGKFVNKP